MDKYRNYNVWILFGALIAGEVLAEENYQIELVVIENKGGNNPQEYFPTSAKEMHLNADKSMAYIAPSASTSNGLKALPGVRYQLSDVAKILKHNKDYRLLYHAAWEQSLKQNHYSKKVYVNGRGIKRIANFAVEGVLAIKPVGDLFYTKLDFILDKSNNNEKSAKFRLKDNGRLKQKELYYFDHPKFGLFVMIKPINETVID
jgi:hypothetical protein